MFQAILWDMDGTLVDTERVVWEVMQRAFKQAANIDLPAELFNSLLGQSELDFYQHMVKRYSLNMASIFAIKSAFDADYIPRLKDVPPLPGAIDKVREFAKRAPQALVTGSTGAQAAAVLQALDLADAFQFIVSCDHYGRGKPDPEPFLTAAKLLEVEPAKCLAIEDSPSGVTAARAAGVKVVGVHEGNQGKYDISHADVVLPSLLELDWDALHRLA